MWRRIKKTQHIAACRKCKRCMTFRDLYKKISQIAQNKQHVCKKLLSGDQRFRSHYWSLWELSHSFWRSMYMSFLHWCTHSFQLFFNIKTYWESKKLLKKPKNWRMVAYQYHMSLWCVIICSVLFFVGDIHIDISLTLFIDCNIYNCIQVFISLTKLKLIMLVMDFLSSVSRRAMTWILIQKHSWYNTLKLQNIALLCVTMA